MSGDDSVGMGGTGRWPVGRGGPPRPALPLAAAFWSVSSSL